MRWLFRLTIFTVFTLSLLVGALLISSLERSPLVTEVMRLDGKGSADAARLGKKLNDLLKSSSNGRLRSHEDELNGVLALLIRARSEVAARVNISDVGLVVGLSLKLPENPVGGYLNLLLQINSNPDRLEIDSLRIGQISIPGTFALKITSHLVDYLLGGGQGRFYTQLIQGVKTEDKAALFYLKPGAELKNQLAQTQQSLRQLGGEMMQLGEPARISYYYQTLQKMVQSAPSTESQQLSYYLGPLFQQASAARDRGFSAVEENRAVLMALAIAFGEGRLRALIVDWGESELSPSRGVLARVTISGRHDLVQHLFVSAALKMVADSGFSHAVGEFKELLDSNGGSGFSFADLAADRTGVKLAEMATKSEPSARKLQYHLKDGLIESDFFPDIGKLPEGLSDKEFKERYHDVQSVAYQDIVARIDQEIALLTIFR